MTADVRVGPDLGQAVCEKATSKLAPYVHSVKLPPPPDLSVTRPSWWTTFPPFTMPSGARVFFVFFRLIPVMAALGFWCASSAVAAKPPDETEKKIRLLGEALHARDAGDLLAARKAVEELTALAPHDASVQRLRAEIETKIALMTTAADKLATESASQAEKKIANDSAVEVAITPASASAAKPLPKRVSFFATRAFVGDEGREVLVKFVVEGEIPRLVLIRGIGPSLKSPTLHKGFLTEPFIELTGAGDLVINSNNDWKKSGDPAFIAAMVSAGGGAPFDGVSKDAAIVTTLAPGSYSVHFSGLRGKTGLGLIEIYQFNP